MPNIARYLLFTECLQNDFVAPIGAGERLPNALHIGRAESARLLGDPGDAWQTDGPLARFVAGWTAGAGAAHHAIHIRDWHDHADPATRLHLDHFGDHCLRGSEGARLVAPLEAVSAPGTNVHINVRRRVHSNVHGNVHIVDSAVLSDFVGTALEKTLRRIIGPDNPPSAVRAGIIGVWTDFKVRYLAYDLITRMALGELAVCSALTASSSRIHHRQALEEIASGLGVAVINSIPEFLTWLGIASGAAPRIAHGRPAPAVHIPEGGVLGDEERRLVEYLFRDCREVTLAPLSGGFSGSRVYRTRSVDRRGLKEVPFVVKVDRHARIARERVAVESIENLLGAASPRMDEYVDLETLGAIKYQFATMHGGEVTTLQRAFRAAPDAATVRRLFDNAVERVLARLYQSPAPDRLQLFRYYDFRPAYAQKTLRLVADLAAAGEDDHSLRIDGLPAPLPHPARFYARLDDLLAEDPTEVLCCWVHGDLNLANLLLDNSGNTWMIDYYWTRVGHAFGDIAKLENDLKFLMVPLAGDAELARAVEWERLLLSRDDLLAPAPPLPAELASDTAIAKAHAAITALYELAASLLRDAGLASPVPIREYRIAQLRYSAHTMTFDECDQRQKLFALASTCLLADLLRPQ